MANKTYDAIVIGGGPGGYVAAIRLGQLKQTVLCVEKEYMGGQYTLDPAFASAPKPFVEFAKAKWQRLIVDGAEAP